MSKISDVHAQSEGVVMTDLVAEELPSKLQAFVDAVETKVVAMHQTAVQNAHPATNPAPKPKPRISQVREQCVSELSPEERGQPHHILGKMLKSPG
jgi:hypothetical protein